jgi:hypothetical protein
MKAAGTKTHLWLYSIAAKRGTTMTRAFASALAPVEQYDEQQVREALTFRGQKNLQWLDGTTLPNVCPKPEGRLCRIKAYHERFVSDAPLVSHRMLTPTQIERMQAIEDQIAAPIDEAACIIESARRAHRPRDP